MGNIRTTVTEIVVDEMISLRTIFIGDVGASRHNV